MEQTESAGPGAYGASLAGGEFNPVEFIKKPQVILRLLSLLFSVIVFGCILHGGYISGHCILQADSNACGYGVWIGIIAFIASLAFLAADALMDRISNAEHRRYIVMADLGFSGFWAFLWFVGFCYLTNKWSNTPNSWLLVTMGVGSWQFNDVQGAIAFTFFSIPVWVGLTYFAYMHFREGTHGLFASAGDVIDHQVTGGLPYQPYPDNPGSGTLPSSGYQQQQPKRQEPPPASSQYQDPLY